ncbi:MAG: acetamidase/formamidase family protein [Bryobacteraceae bacterium]|nr:acetamidase/formamidase family protein [Bryobacteraceae bacterium]
MRLFAFLLASCAVLAGQSSSDWVVEVRHRGELMFVNRSVVTVDGGTVSGTSGPGKLRGTLNGDEMQVEWVMGDRVEGTMRGSLKAGRLTGSGKTSDGLVYDWLAYRVPPQGTAPRTHEFTPENFERYFSAATPAVLRIAPGDTVRTWSVDAGGVDAKGTRRSRGGNPLTGPFYVEGALPGDTLAVKLNKVRINRDWAESGNGLMSNAISPDYNANLKRAKDLGGRWKLDAQSGMAALDKPSEALKNFRVPIEPMLGCVSVAPRGQEVVATRDSGYFGGNMDYNRIREGTTVYLTVNQPGGLLMVGDGHAAQGDGELTGDALETSMDIEFTVELIRGKGRGLPWAEDKDWLMMIGIAGSLDEALRRATTGLARYLEGEHGLNSTEAALVLGFAVKYDIADLVGTQVSIVARLPKTVIAQLPPRKAE